MQKGEGGRGGREGIYEDMALNITRSLTVVINCRIFQVGGNIADCSEVFTVSCSFLCAEEAKVVTSTLKKKNICSV